MNPLEPQPNAEPQGFTPTTSGGTLATGTRFETNNLKQIEQTIQDLPFVPPVTVRSASGIRIHGIQTAWVAIKSAHYALRGIEAMRFPTILADTRWTTPKPVLSWILEHEEGLMVIDSGEQAGVTDLQSYMACADPINRYIVVNNFRLQSMPEMQLDAQLKALGLAARDVRFVVQTHLHFDHADGLGFVPNATVLAARAEITGHQKNPVGAVRCKYPAGLELTPVDYAASDFASFERHHSLTKSQDVLLVPTPGHSYGHQSVVLRDHRHDYFFAGDVSFDLGQLEQRQIGGISHDLAQARDSLERVRRYARTSPLVYLPSHDPESLKRLANNTTCNLTGEI